MTSPTSSSSTSDRGRPNGSVTPVCGCPRGGPRYQHNRHGRCRPTRATAHEPIQSRVTRIERTDLVTDDPEGRSRLYRDVQELIDCGGVSRARSRIRPDCGNALCQGRTGRHGNPPTLGCAVGGRDTGNSLRSDRVVGTLRQLAGFPEFGPPDQSGAHPGYGRCFRDWRLRVRRPSCAASDAVSNFPPTQVHSPTVSDRARTLSRRHRKRPREMTI